MNENGSQQLFATSVTDQTALPDGAAHAAASVDGKLVAGDDAIETLNYGCWKLAA